MRPALLILAPLLAAGCLGDRIAGAGEACEPEPAPLDHEAFCLVTPDGWALHGLAGAGPGEGDHVVVLVHGLGEDANAFTRLVQDLLDDASAVVRFDLRGHGASGTRGGEPASWRNFDSGPDFEQMDGDVARVVSWTRGALGDARPLVLVGASLGANLAIRHAAADPDGTDAVVLLSPGLDYRGVSAEAANAAYGGRVLFVASAEDAYAVESAKILHERSRAAVRELEVWDGKGHGTQMLDPEGRGVVVAWIRDHAKPPARADGGGDAGGGG